jgi:8-oxo-dGTP diphosphatase
MSGEVKRFLAAKAIIRNREGKFLILRESGSYDEGTNIGKWDVPGGRLEEEETLHDGLAREVSEEVGLKFVVERLLDARENFPVIKNQKTHIVRLYYLCSTTDTDVILSTDHDRFEWITKEELQNYEVMLDVKELIGQSTL